MKTPLTPIAALVALLVGIAVIVTFSHVEHPRGDPYDFVFISQTAVSNATRFNVAPDGFKILCSPDGRYVPSYQGMPLDMLGYAVRTSHWHAVVTAWRFKEIIDTPPPPRPKQNRTWEECK